MRAINLCPDGGNATVSVNNVNSTGTQIFKQASAYSSVNVGANFFSFTLSNKSGTSYPAINVNLTKGNFYSAFLFGRGDVTNSSDPRYPQLIVVTDDRTLPAGTNARLRVVQGAPDGGSATFLLNGTAIGTNLGYTTIGGYQDVPSGNASVQVTAPGTSGATQTVNLLAGHLYTLSFIEPTLTPNGTYGTQLSNDGP